MLRRFGHVERLEGDELVKKVSVCRMRGGNLRGKPMKGWLNNVKKALSRRGKIITEM